MYQAIIEVSRGDTTVIYWQSGGSLLEGLDATRAERTVMRANEPIETCTRVVRDPAEAQT